MTEPPIPKYSVEVAPAAERALKKTPADVRKRIFKALLSLADEPRPSGVKKLSGEENLYRIRTGDYRIVYQIKHAVLMVLVVKVGHRRDIYR
ncbi:MAG: type II toxin-antitoxin system RelE/ParE family toxin [Deltaproteobacteria bacterium]|nr:type II toxin-antitoxin system RelE/ParE family toxin [Deltaproteobacteria bacterium]